MGIQTRNQLKSYFRNGSFVKQDYFFDLIDSSLNQLNDDIRHDDTNAFSLMPAGNKFISFFKTIGHYNNSSPLAFLELGSAKKGMRSAFGISVPGIQKGDPTRKLLHFTQKVKTGKLMTGVGINTDKPRFDLEVNGAVGAKARIGTLRTPQMNAALSDRSWHPIIPGLTGFNAFEVMVLAEDQQSHQFSMAHGVVLGTGKKTSVSMANTVNSSWFDRLQFRWKVSGDNYALEVRTAKRYKSPSKLKIQLTQLW